MNQLLLVVHILVLLAICIVNTVPQNVDHKLEAIFPTFSQWEICRFGKDSYNNDDNVTPHFHFNFHNRFIDAKAEIGACYTQAMKYLNEN